MPLPVPTLRLVLAAGLAVCLAAAPPARAQTGQRTLEAHYTVYWMGLPVYSARMAGDWTAAKYTMRFSAEAEGVARAFATNRIDWTTQGAIRGPVATPVAFRQANTFRQQTRNISLVYVGGSVAVAVIPPESPGKRPTVPEPLRAGTIDPLTAVFATLRAPADVQRCGHESKVFEGLRRTDIRIEHAGRERTPRDVDAAGLPKETLVCLVHAKRLAGYEDKHFKQNPEPLPPARIWVGYFAEPGVWLPVQLRFESRYGPLYVRLTKWSHATTPAP